MSFSLHGAMIPRRVRRLFDQRFEPRLEPDHGVAVFGWRRRQTHVTLCNLSTEGAMIQFGEVPHIGERVSLQILDRGTATGHVRWVRDGRIGINFTAPLE
jgi:hypothetical protein